MELRVVVDGPRDPRMNMAIDEAILRAGPAPTLRIYMWLPGGLTIGRRQSVGEVSLAEAERRGYVLVRRPTGGAALLHPWEREVTYSIVLNSSHPFYSLDVAESAAMIAGGVALALEELGVATSVGGYDPPQGVSGGLCYVRPGSSDVVVAGRKVSGSAQRRIGGRLLQHGTLLLRFDPEEWVSIIPVKGAGARELASKIAGIEDLTSRSYSFSEIARALVKGFSRALGLQPKPSGLSGEEVEEALRLYEEKYSTPRWNLEGEEP
ncbi:lipoate--protein ligase family protein [Aeropyrum camini]|uniref:Lipoate-protein ligase n=1 Tax=Aeropyrum camini SY1 = JCM 12091 TaxID=1198449 RepID=U3TBM5_9CREN|nr:biotin/lipoate A/B protein ligase family protein [Aeropyrum camini]BAN90942.1 lipoate-protein ligase [Aeropyrum camini SY1 = JCM 12091]